MISFLTGFLLFFSSYQELNQILDDHFSAMGQNYLSSFRTGVIEGKIIQNNSLEYDFITYQKRPHKVRKELRIGKETIVEVFDGTIGWHRDFNNEYDLSPEEAEKLKIEGLMDTRLEYLRSKAAKVRNLGKKTINDGRYYHLQIDHNKLRTNFFIDEKTNLLFRIIEETLGVDRLITEITYFNYRDFGGIQMPMIIRKIGPEGRFQTIIEEIAFDVAVSESLFQKP